MLASTAHAARAKSISMRHSVHNGARVPSDLYAVAGYHFQAILYCKISWYRDARYTNQRDTVMHDTRTSATPRCTTHEPTRHRDPRDTNQRGPRPARALSLPWRERGSSPSLTSNPPSWRRSGQRRSSANVCVQLRRSAAHRRSSGNAPLPPFNSSSAPAPKRPRSIGSSRVTPTPGSPHTDHSEMVISSDTRNISYTPRQTPATFRTFLIRRPRHFVHSSSDARDISYAPHQTPATFRTTHFH